MSTTDILMNSAALNSLKRNQLVSLCKLHGLKANGKNADLINKLQEFAMNNPTREAATLPNLAEKIHNSQTDTGSEDGDMKNDQEMKEAERVRMRPSEIWEVIEEETMEEMQKLREESINGKGSLQSYASKGSRLKVPGEFGAPSTLSKSSSVSSSLKSLATSFKWGSTKGNAQTSSSTVAPPMPVESEIEPTEMDIDTNMMDVSIELDHQTVRLVKFNPQPSYPSPPPLRPFRPSLPLAPLSPDPKVSLFPSIPKELVYTPVKPSPLSTNPMMSPTATTALKKPEPFIFGSPAPRHSVSNAEFDAAASSVLEEMNRRLGIKGAATVSSSILSGRELGKAQQTLDEIERTREEIEFRASRPIKSPPKRFSDAHKKQFEKMESIADYVARRDKQRSDPLGPIERKRKSNVLDDNSFKNTQSLAPKRESGMPGGFGNDDDAEEPGLPKRDARRVRVSEAPIGGDKDSGAPRVRIAESEQKERTKEKQDQAEKEREVIRRKLEASRARRRSSRGRPSTSGRPSIGKVAPQPKKGIYSRFGFLKGAVGAVKSVWNRGTGVPTPAVKSALVVARPSTNTSTARPSTLAPTAPAARKVSAGLNRGLIPSFGSSTKSRTCSNANTGSSRMSTTQKMGGGSKSKISSVGFKRASHLDANTTAAGVDGASVRGSLASASKKERTSFMAPTQSSLAKANLAKASITTASDNQPSDVQKVTQIPLPSPSGLKSPLLTGHPGPVRREPVDITNLTSPTTARRPLPIPPLRVAMKEKSFGSLTARHEDPNEGENVSTDDQTGGPSNLAPDRVSATGSLIRKPSHRPRISRTHIVAKLHARRLASDSSHRSSISNRSLKRKSLSGAAGSGGVKATIGISRHSGAGGASALAAKRRVRASEVARRKSRAPSLVSVTNAGAIAGMTKS